MTALLLALSFVWAAPATLILLVVGVGLIVNGVP